MKFNSLFLFALLYCFIFSSCSVLPDETTLTIKNEASDSKIILIDCEKKYTIFNIINGEEKRIKNKVMKEIEYIYIRSKEIEGIFHLRRGRKRGISILDKIDHEIIIKNDYFIWNDQTEGITASYVKYSNRANEVVDFETVKRINFEDIYDIIKN